MKMMILDGSGYMYRAYHGLPPLHDHQGQAVHAVFGFFKMLFKIFYEKPDYFVIAWDAPHKTVRHEAFKEYKATRPPTPDDLKHQIVMIKKIIAQLQIPFLEVP
jgi:DNA polymerase-1